MRTFIAVLLAASAIAGQALAVDPPSCAVPDNLLFVDNSLNRVAAAVGKQHQLAIAVYGTGSSTI
ncbi:MAG TPA: SGNH/GDSL hydrolase family protein, partial [Bradyrhizobium sp.]|nr:SGNH/GDSL hydrolase family protein [Bradyrhizobium sp.]